jgi:hypothetical protein
MESLLHKKPKNLGVLPSLSVVQYTTKSQQKKEQTSYEMLGSNQQIKQIAFTK